MAKVHDLDPSESQIQTVQLIFSWQSHCTGMYSKILPIAISDGDNGAKRREICCMTFVVGSCISTHRMYDDSSASNSQSAFSYGVTRV